MTDKPCSDTHSVTAHDSQVQQLQQVLTEQNSQHLPSIHLDWLNAVSDQNLKMALRLQ